MPHPEVTRPKIRSAPSGVRVRDDAGGDAMKMRDWDEQGGRPSFGHRAYWVEDLLDAIDASEIASYALTDAETGPDDAASARRFLVACEVGLLDARAAADDAGRPVLGSVLIPWSDVSGIRLSGVTGLDDAYRHATEWSVAIDSPAVRIQAPDQPAALLELVRECLVRTQVPPPLKPSSGEG
jgi:hypothetical protein